MAISNRETYRDALVALFSTSLTGTGKPAQAVYGYMIGDFAGQSPVVVVSSAGSEREQGAVTSRQKCWFYFNVYTFTLYAQVGTSWAEDDAEDRSDLLEKTIAEVIVDNRSTATWSFIELDGRSVVDSVIVAGEEYKRETIPVKILVYDN